MKTTFNIFIVTLSFCLLQACKKDKPTPPVLTTTAISEISYTIAKSGGEITNEGGAAIVSNGVCWNTFTEPTIADSRTTDKVGLGVFISNLTQLTPNTLYYVRAYATNSVGTGYGNQVTFTTTKIEVPVLTTTLITSITQTTAISGGNITDDKGGYVTARGACWGIISNPTTANDKTSNGTGPGSFVSNLTGLIGNTIYYVRAYATNSAGTEYGNQISFTSSPTLPTLNTTTVSLVSTTSCSSGGNVINEGGASVTARGVCWSTLSTPTIASNKTIDGTGAGSFESNLRGLISNTTYFIRAYATNYVGTAYGDQLTFNTDPATVLDIDENIYNVVKIGTQLWIKENLKATRYNDGTTIPYDPGCNYSGSAKYTWYHDNNGYTYTYGALYSWYTVETGKLCPIGWHVPSEGEWTILSNYLGGDSIAGGKLKEVGIAHWASPNAGAKNSSGFTALPGGYRLYEWDPFYDLCFLGIGNNGAWWSATEKYSYNAKCRGLQYESIGFSNFDQYKGFMYSVRCIRD